MTTRVHRIELAFSLVDHPHDRLHRLINRLYSTAPALAIHMGIKHNADTGAGVISIQSAALVPAPVILRSGMFSGTGLIPRSVRVIDGHTNEARNIYISSLWEGLTDPNFDSPYSARETLIETQAIRLDARIWLTSWRGVPIHQVPITWDYDNAASYHEQYLVWADNNLDEGTVVLDRRSAQIAASQARVGITRVTEAADDMRRDMEEAIADLRALAPRCMSMRETASQVGTTPLQQVVAWERTHRIAVIDRTFSNSLITDNEMMAEVMDAADSGTGLLSAAVLDEICCIAYATEATFSEVSADFEQRAARLREERQGALLLEQERLEQVERVERVTARSHERWDAPSFRRDEERLDSMPFEQLRVALPRRAERPTALEALPPEPTPEPEPEPVQVHRRARGVRSRFAANRDKMDKEET